ncbi:cell surface glycoprotein MUC18 isoform X2 [Ambystoma mexicanum]|uniref:cell surface glycoprotein MUC18 isoform X2 n=1 Tax=Ambystoma mexicanum TaxID=8296 RepID=UPI0037E9C100
MALYGICSSALFLLALVGSSGGVAGKVLVSVPDVVEVVEGGTAQIKCSFNSTGLSNYTYQHWLYLEKDVRTQMSYMGPDRDPNSPSLLDTDYKERISVLPDFTLVIRDVTLQDERPFVCQIGAGMAGFAEGRAELHVYRAPELPVIKASSDGILVTSETPEKIAECLSRNGYPAPNITWYKGQSPLHPVDDKIRVETVLTTESSGLLTVSSTLYSLVQKQDRDALFYCEVNFRMPGSDRMMESDRVNITVFYPTEKVTLVIESPQEAVKEGDTVTLFCEGDGSPPPEYSFQRVLESKNGEVGLVDMKDVSGEYLVLENVKKEDSGRYRCLALDPNNFDSDLEDEVKISVNYLESIETSPDSSVQVSLGEDLLVQCTASASMPTAFQWKKQGELVMPGPELSLSNMTYEMAGQYHCAVSVLGVPGLNGSESINITVRGRPHIMAKQRHVLVRENEMVNLTCEAFGHPAPVITWDADGSVTHTRESHRVSSQLSVLATTELLESGVTCNASNSLGSSDHTIHLEARVVVATTTILPTVTHTELKAGESKGVLIVVIIVCILLLAILGAVLYFLYKKGKIACGRSGKQSITNPDDQRDDIVVEMKSDKLPEEAELLQESNNGEKRPSSDQGEKYIDLRN